MGCAPLVNAFAMVITSGTTSKASAPKGAPVLPKPVCNAVRLQGVKALEEKLGVSAAAPVAVAAAGGGGGDAAAGALGIGAIGEGDAFVSLGTSGQLFVSSDNYRAAPGTVVHCYAHCVPDRWFQMAAMLALPGAAAFHVRFPPVGARGGLPPPVLRPCRAHRCSGSLRSPLRPHRRSDPCGRVRTTGFRSAARPFGLACSRLAPLTSRAGRST